MRVWKVKLGLLGNNFTVKQLGKYIENKQVAVKSHAPA